MFALTKFPSTLGGSEPGSGHTSDNESFGSLSLPSLTVSTTLPSRLRLPRDMVQEILLLTISMEGTLRQYTRLCLVCRDWDVLLNEPYVWAMLARRFVPAFPLIHTVRFVPIIVPEALSSLSGGAHHNPHGVGESVTTGLSRASRAQRRRSTADNPSGRPTQVSATLGGDAHHQRTFSMVSTGASSDQTGLGTVGTGRGGAPLGHSRSLSLSLDVEGGGPRHNRAGSSLPSVSMISPSSIATSPSAPSPPSNLHGVGAGGAFHTSAHAGATSGRYSLAKMRHRIAKRWARRRRQVMRTVRDAMDLNDEAQRELGAVPTRDTIRAAVEGLREYKQWLVMNRIVAQRRRFVLQAWMSGGLFFASCAVGANVCAAEGMAPSSYCDFDVGFSFLYLAYLCVFGVAISNVFMATHYEPLALIPRMGRNTALIGVSSIFLTAWVLGVIVPTYLVQQKVGGIVRGWNSGALMAEGDGLVGPISGFSGPTPTAAGGVVGVFASAAGVVGGISWTQTIMTLIIAMSMWQVGVVVTLWHEVVGWARQPRLTWEHVKFIIPHLTPTFLAGSAAAFAGYLDTGHFGLLAVTLLPLLGIFGVLTIVFGLDAYHHGRESDIVVTIALGNLVVTFLAVLAADKPRGLHGFPVFVCSVSMFVGQMRSMLRLLDSVLWDEDVE